MKILFITPYIPSRIRVRPFEIIKELAKTNEVSVISLAEGSENPSGLDEIHSCCQSVEIISHPKLKGYFQSLKALATKSPMCAGYCWSSDMDKAVNNKINAQPIDVIHIEHIRAAHFLPKTNIPAVFDGVDCLSSLFRQMSRSRKNIAARLIALEEAWKLSKYEPSTMRKFHKAIITSEAEKKSILDMDSLIDIEVVENGVDTNYFAPKSIKKRKQIIFSGKMSYQPNAQAAIWFAEKVFPIIKSKVPDAEFIIVGSGPPASVTKLADISGIKVTGYVDDIRPYLAESSVAVTPMQIAVGIQNKALEAAAMQLPVVATSIVKQAFSDRIKSIIEINDPIEMAEAIIDLLNNPMKAKELGESAREDVIKNYSWHSQVIKLNKIYEDLVKA